MRVVESGRSSFSVIKVNSIDLKNKAPPRLIKYDIKIINNEIGYLKKYFLFKQ